MYGASKRGGGRGGYSGNSSQPKKPRNDEDEEDTPNFEDHLAGLEDEDFIDCDFPASEAEGPEQQLTHQKWSRPNPPSLDPSRDKLVFQQVELDHYIGQARVDMLGAREGPAPIMRMFGITMDGNSVCFHVHGFHPYIYLPAPTGVTPENLSIFRKALNSALLADIKKCIWYS